MSITTALVIAAASWSVLACIGAPGVAWFVGRIRRRARTYTDWSLWQPDVPNLRTVSDADWLADQPEMLADDAPPPLILPAGWTLEELEQAVTAHEFVEIVWVEFPEYRKDFSA